MRLFVALFLILSDFLLRIPERIRTLQSFKVEKLATKGLKTMFRTEDLALLVNERKIKSTAVHMRN